MATNHIEINANQEQKTSSEQAEVALEQKKGEVLTESFGESDSEQQKNKNLKQKTDAMFDLQSSTISDKSSHIKALDDNHSQEVELWQFPPLDENLKSFSYLTQENANLPMFSELDETLSIPVKSPEKIRQEAEEQGYQEGFAKGQQEGLIQISQQLEQEYQQKWQEKLAMLTQLIELIERPLANLDEQVDEMLLLLVQKLVIRLVRQEFSNNPEKLMALIISLKEEMGHGRHLSIYLSPLDFEKLQSILHETLSGQIHADEKLAVGDVRIESDSGALQAILEERLALLLSNS